MKMVFTESSQLIKKHNLSQLISCVFVLSFVFLQFNNLSFENSPIQNESEDFYELNFEFDDCDDDDDLNSCTLLTFNINHLSFINAFDNKKTSPRATLTFQYSSRAPPLT
jgi:hypothetical protein